jgi:type IV pilus assembly protein PilE
MKTMQSKANTGFSMIELMIVLAIIGILTAIAVPAYSKYIQTARRSDAIAILTQDQGILERCYAQTFDYYNVNAGTNCGTLVTTSPGKYYTVTFDTPAPSSTSSAYVLTAAPATGSPQLKDTPCQSFTLSSTAGKSSSPGTTGTCWQQ